MSNQLKVVGVMLVAGMVFGSAAYGAISTPLNNDFESQDIIGFGNNTTVDDWTATDNAGLVDGNDGTSYPGPATNQWGVIFASGPANNTTTGGSFEQNIGTVDAGSTPYRLTFDQAQNAGGGAINPSLHTTIVEILVDGNIVATYDALPTIPAQGTGFSNEIFDFTLDTADAAVDAGDPVMLRFSGTVGVSGTQDDRAQWVFDNVQIRVIPEPASTALMGVGGLLLMVRRRK